MVFFLFVGRPLNYQLPDPLCPYTMLFRSYLSMASSDRPADITVQIWPETALPLALANDADGRAAVAAAIPKSGVLLTGSVRFPEGTRAEREARNSLDRKSTRLNSSH